MDNKYDKLFKAIGDVPQKIGKSGDFAKSMQKLRDFQNSFSTTQRPVNMDNKYGHLYTAEDMLAFARIYAGSGVDIANDFNEEAADELLDDFEGRFPKDEPLFLLRGQDRRALAAVRNYRTMVSYSGGKEPSAELMVGLDTVVDQFEDFQADHSDRVKEPD